MTETNLLRFFILLEGGVVALLATALAKHNSNEPTESQLRFWRGFAQLCGLPLSKTGPQKVEVEKYRVDLLATWDHWALLVEAKTKREHVKEHQLQTYYERLRSKLGKSDMLSETSSIAVVFLTPTGVGEREFSSLTVGNTDKKVHLNWADVLSLIESSFDVFKTSTSDPTDAFVFTLMSLGSQRVRELLCIEPPKGRLERAAQHTAGVDR